MTTPQVKEEGCGIVGIENCSRYIPFGVLLFTFFFTLLSYLLSVYVDPKDKHAITYSLMVPSHSDPSGRLNSSS